MNTISKHIKAIEDIKAIKAVFFDVDGTLFDLKNHCVPTSTIKALHALKENGYKIGVASSRPLSSIYHVESLKAIPWDGIVGANGIEIWDEKPSLLEDNTLSQETLYQIFSIAKKNNIAIYAAGEESFLTGMNDTVVDFISHFALPKEAQQVKTYAGQKEKLLTLITYEREGIWELFEEVKGIKIIDGGALNIDLFPAHVSKATGIHTLMKHWGFASQEYMCFGDAASDIPMIEDAYLGVAMGNGSEEVKSIADHVCKAYDEDGIYECLKQFKLI